MNQSPSHGPFTMLSRASGDPSAEARHRLLPLVAAILFLLAPFPSPAQKTPKTAPAAAGSLKGTVSAVNGDTLIGVTVKLAKQPTGKPVSAETDENGNYEFHNLAPGTYAISVEAVGFKKSERPMVLKEGEQSVQDFNLDVETVAETVQVTGMPTIISTESSSAPVSVVTNTQLVTLPTQQEQVKEVIPVTPGVVRTLDSKLVFKGSDENQSLLIINSTRNTDPVTGSFGITVPTDAVESFAVYKTPYDASLGSFSGGLTTIATKSPSDSFDFNLTKLGITVLGKEGHTAGLGGANPAISFDVPLIVHKLLLSEVFQYQMKKTTVEGLPWPDDISKKQGFNSYSTLEAILSNHHLLTLTVNAFPLRTDHIDISALIPQPASNSLNQSGVTIALADRYEFASHAVLSTVAQYTRFDSNAHGYGPDDMLITPEGYGGNYFNTWSRRGKEFQFLSNYEFAKTEWHGTHEIRTGVDVDWRSFFGTTESRPIQILRGDNSLAETITFNSAPAQTPSDSIYAAFVQDHWLMGSHVSADLGLRFTTETLGWAVGMAPRIGLAYSPGKDEKTVLRAGAGLFYGVLPLLAATWDANPDRTITQFDASGLPLGPPTTYQNIYTANLNPLVAPGLPAQTDTTPRNVTWNLGFVRELHKNLQLDVNYLNSRTNYLFVVQPFTAPSPTDPSYLGLTNTGSSNYHELETSVRYSFRDSDQLKASYIYSQARGDLNNISSIMIPFAAPVVRPNVYGIVASDIPNRFIAWAILAFPWKITFSPLVDIHTGFPWSPVDVNQQYVGTPNGQRFPLFFSLDLKAYRTFRVPFWKGKNGKQHHFRLGGYSLNVTNHGNFSTVYNNVTSPNYGKFVGFLYRHEGMTLDFVD